MTRVMAVSSVFPPHRYPQGEIAAALARFMPSPADAARLHRLHDSVGVRTRHLALPLDRYGPETDFGTANAHYLDAAGELGVHAVESALAAAGLGAHEVDLVLSTTVTGIAAPSLEARIAARTGMRPDVRRLPLFGLGCAGGAAGLARLHDHLSGHPDHAALLLSAELCSLTLQPGDASAANLVASALFGDGAGALLAVGRGHPLHRSGPGPSVVASRSHLYPGTEGLLGWDVGHWGFRVVLGRELPDLVGLHVAGDIEGFLAGHDLKPADVDAWIVHPGGPKVLDVLAEALSLPEPAFDASRRSLASAGNLSSASVLHVLGGVQAAGPPAPGAVGLMVAFGPGFACELVLLRW